MLVIGPTRSPVSPSTMCAVGELLTSCLLGLLWHSLELLALSCVHVHPISNLPPLSVWLLLNLRTLATLGLATALSSALGLVVGHVHSLALQCPHDCL